MATNKTIKNIIHAIENGRFPYKSYATRKMRNGVEIMTQPLHCSYGQIGYSVFIYENGSHTDTIEYDWEMNKFRVNDMSLEEWSEENKHEEFLAELKELLTKYNAEIDTVGVRVNGKTLRDWGYADDDEPFTENDILVLASDTL